MRSLRKCVIVITAIICLATSVFAGENSKVSSTELLSNGPSISAAQAVQKYFKNLVLKSVNKTRSLLPLASTHPLDQICHDRQSCVDVACKYSGNCGFSSTLNDIITACHNTNGECVQAACEYSGNCGFSSTLRGIMNSCNGADGDCVRSSCKYSGNCGFSSTLNSIIKSCGGQ